MLTDDERLSLIGLAMTRSIGPRLLDRLLARFGTLGAVLSASVEDLRTVQGIGPVIAGSIRRIDLRRLESELARFESQGIAFATWQDSAYPPALLKLDDKPLVVFWKGAWQWEADDCRAIAIVGTREAQPQWARYAREYGKALAQRGWLVVSGMARGIDSAGQRGALEGGGRTLAVLGCGVNVVYPPENHALAKDIAANGALLCEVHPDTSPSPNALTRRNRLITALSAATLVIEAGGASGALHAARCAHAQGRPVYAVDNSEGNAALLQDFAQPLPDDVDDLLADVMAR
ncbi:MAG TPA: DNA-processing protein DprA [Aggregatilineales bacterium]|nr:DNA-processing protein DprA [Aggregatilineales bacterium]